MFDVERFDAVYESFIASNERYGRSYTLADLLELRGQNHRFLYRHGGAPFLAEVTLEDGPDREWVVVSLCADASAFPMDPERCSPQPSSQDVLRRMPRLCAHAKRHFTGAEVFYRSRWLEVRLSPDGGRRGVAFVFAPGSSSYHDDARPAEPIP